MNRCGATDDRSREGPLIIRSGQQKHIISIWNLSTRRQTSATLKLNLTIQLFFFSLNVTWKCKNVKSDVSAAPPTLRSRSAGELNLESPQRNVVSGCWQQKPRWDLACRERGPERASGDWGQMCSGAITLTDRHPLPNFYAKQEKRRRRKISGSLRGGKGRHLSFALVAPGQETPPAFEGETTMKRALHLHKNTCLY